MKGKRFIAFLLAAILAFPNTGMLQVNAEELIEEIDTIDTISEETQEQEEKLISVDFRGEENVSDYKISWLFDDETLEVQVNTEDSSTTEISLGFESEDENGDTVFEALANQEGLFDFDTESGKLTLYGEAISEAFLDAGYDYFLLRVAVPVEEGEDGDIIWPFVIKDTWIEYDYPCSRPGDSNILVGESIHLASTVWSWGVNQEFADGYEGGAEVIDVEILEQISYIDGEHVVESGVVELCEYDDGSYEIVGLDYGRARIKMIIEDWAFGGTREYEFEVHSIGDYYVLNLQYPENSNHILPNDEKEIHTEVVRRFLNEEGNQQEENVDVNRVAYIIDGEERDAYETKGISFGIKGTNFKVATSDFSEDFGESVRVRAYYSAGEEEHFCHAILDVNCAAQYTIISVDDSMPESVPAGYTIDLKEYIGWYQYKAGSEPVNLLEDSENYRIILEWDDNAWCKADESDESTVPELKRISDFGNDLVVIAQFRDQETGEWVEDSRNNIWFRDLDYSIWLESVSENCDRDWLYKDEDITYRFNTDNLTDNVDINVWVANPTEDDANILPEETYTLENVNGEMLVTLHGSVLKDYFEEGDDHFMLLFNVTYKQGDEEYSLFEDNANLWLRDSWADYNLPDEWISLLLGDDYWISKEIHVSYEDKDHPWGADQDVKITDIEVLRHRAYEEDGAVPTGKSIIRVDEHEEGWNLHGADHGETDFRITYEDISGEEQTHDLTVTSAGEHIYAEMVSWDDRVRVTPDSTTNVEVQVVRRYIDEKDNQHEEILEGTIEYVIGENEYSSTYEDDFANYSIDGQAMVIQSKSEISGERRVGVRATGTYEDTQGNEQQYECGFELILEANEEVYTIKLQNPSAIDAVLNVGEEVDLREAQPELWVQRTGEEAVKVSEEEVYFTVDDWDGNAWNAMEREEDSISLMERTGTWETNLQLVARSLETHDEFARYSFDFSSLETSFKNLRGGDWTWVFDDECEYRLDLDMRSFSKSANVKVEWTVGNIDNEQMASWTKIDGTEDRETLESYIENSHYVIDQDGTSISLNGANLAETFRTEENNRIDVLAVVKISGKEVCRLETSVELREMVCRLEGEDGSELLFWEGSGWVYEQNTIDAYVECGAYPHGKNVTLYIENIDLRNHDDENPAFTLYSDRYTGYWNIYAERPGGATATFTVSHGRIGELQIVKELYTSDKIYMLHAFSDNGSHMLLPGEEMNLITDFYLYERDENGKAVETRIPEEQYELKMWADDNQLLSCNPETGTVKAYKNENGGTNVHVEVTFTENGEEITREYALWVEVSDYIVTLGSETYYAEPNSIQDIDKFDLYIVEKYIDENGEMVVNTFDADKARFEDVGNANYFWITWWKQKLAVNNNITRELPMMNCVYVVAECDGQEYDGWVNVVVCEHEYHKETQNTENGETTTFDLCDKCGHVKNYKTFSLSETSFVYNTEKQKPTVIVKDKDGNAISTWDYSVDYASGCKDVGTYDVTIRFNGEYSGTETLSFEITPKNVTPTITLSETQFIYNKKTQTPKVTVTDGSKIISSDDYKVSYSSGRKNVGKYTVKVTLKNNYSGTKSVTYTIVPKGTSISSVTAASKAFKVTWKKQSSQVDGYQIQYSTSSKFSSAKTVTVKGASSVSTTVKKLSAKKKYYVRVRTYKKASGTTYYSAWSSAKSVKTKS